MFTHNYVIKMTGGFVGFDLSALDNIPLNHDTLNAARIAFLAIASTAMIRDVYVEAVLIEVATNLTVSEFKNKG